MKQFIGILSFLCALCTLNSTIQAFTIINGTDVEQKLQFKEAGKRPKSEVKGVTLCAPEAYNKKAKVIKVPARSTVQCALTPCYFLYCGLVKTSKKGNSTTTHTSERLYGPDNEETQITTQWGLVVYETPKEHKSPWFNDKYSVKLLTPEELAQK